MIPMADNFNHSDVHVGHDLCNKSMHLSGNEETNYFTRTKFMNDFSLAFEESDYIDNPVMTKNVKGRFSRVNYEKNKQFSSLVKIREALDAGV